MFGVVLEAASRVKSVLYEQDILLCAISRVRGSGYSDRQDVTIRPVVARAGIQGGKMYGDEMMQLNSQCV